VLCGVLVQLITLFPRMLNSGIQNPHLTCVALEKSPGNKKLKLLDAFVTCVHENLHYTAVLFLPGMEVQCFTFDGLGSPASEEAIRGEYRYYLMWMGAQLLMLRKSKKLHCCWVVFVRCLLARKLQAYLRRHGLRNKTQVGPQHYKTNSN
jgi:hypothetical protein